MEPAALRILIQDLVNDTSSTDSSTSDPAVNDPQFSNADDAQEQQQDEQEALEGILGPTVRSAGGACFFSLSSFSLQVCGLLMFIRLVYLPPQIFVV